MNPADDFSKLANFGTGSRYELILKSWNAAGSSGKRTIQVRVFSTAGGSWIDEQFGADANNPQIAAWNEDPDHDGVNNLLERAFNLSPLQPGAATLITGTGTTGLPNIRSTGSGASRRLKIEYLRRKSSTNPGLSYTPQFLSELGTASQDFTGPETVQSIDSVWERVTVDDTTTGEPKRFGRVRVVTVQ